MDFDRWFPRAVQAGIEGKLPEPSRCPPMPTVKPCKADPEGEPRINFLGDLQRLRPEPGDVFVLSTDQVISDETARRLREVFTEYLNGAKVIVLGDGLKLGVVAMPEKA